MPGSTDEFFEAQNGAAGLTIGPKLKGTMFVPPGYGVCFIDSNGAYWLHRLAQDQNGATAFDDDGYPTIELVQAVP